MSYQPTILSIAGFDPSSGAGISADIKVFENFKLIGLGVCTSITIQNEEQFEGVAWVEFQQIKDQLQVLAQKHEPSVVKIGLIESIEVLNQVVKLVRNLWKNTYIIWDPIIKTSSGFAIHNDLDSNLLQEAVNEIQLITPNTGEFAILSSHLDLQNTNYILQKGGHNQEQNSNDVLLKNGKEVHNFEGERIEGLEKHGSGCTLSSAIGSYLTKGNDLKSSIRLAKEYTLDFLSSTNTLLGLQPQIKEQVW